MNAIFAVEVRQESDFARFAFHSATPLSFLSGEPRPIFFRHDSETFLHRCEIAKLAARLPRVGQREEFIPAVSRFALSFPILFPSLFSVPPQLPFISSVSLSLSRSRQSTGTLTVAMD